MDWLTPLYPWTKALHIVAVIAWMAGMLYLPRLFVYHCGAAPGTPASEMLKVMERRLLRAIINPAMIVTVLLGVALLATPGVADWSQGWLHAKLALGRRHDRRAWVARALAQGFRGRPQPAARALLSDC